MSIKKWWNVLKKWSGHIFIVGLLLAIGILIALTCTHDHYAYEAKCTEVPMWYVRDVNKLGKTREHFFIHMLPEEREVYCENGE